MENETSNNRETGNLQQGDVSGCPFINAQIEIIKELDRIIKLPPKKTVKGSILRALKMHGWIIEIKKIQEAKKIYSPILPFEIGGGINNFGANEIFVDGHEHIINVKTIDDDL